MRQSYFPSVVVTLWCSILLAGCGGSSQNPPALFTKASLNGAYTFSIKGVTSVGIAGTYSLIGVFQADGNGNLTQGHTFYTINTGAGTGSFGNQEFFGFYNVGPDGRGTATLSTQIAGPVIFDFVLLSDQHGEVVRFDHEVSPSGTLDKLDASLTATDLTGTWAFNLNGIDSAGNPKASVGVFTADSSGVLTSGTVDTNDNGAIQSNVAMQLGPASEIFINPGSGRGGLQFSTAADGGHSFVLTVIDANHLRLQSTAFDVLTGDAYRVTDTGISGSFAFTMTGETSLGVFAHGGIINTDDAGNILNTSVSDIDHGGLLGQGQLIGTYTSAGNRTFFSLQGGAIGWVGYPSSGGIQLLKVDADAVASGVALPQTGPFSSATLNGRYGATFSGISPVNGQFGAIAQLTADDSGQLNGTLNLNQNGAPTPDIVLNGSFAFSPSGRGTGTLATPSSTRNVIYYAADSNRVLFMQFDPGQVAQGVLAKQQ